jgi:patatin-like phospholipase/acyl hydrolase
MDKHLFKILSIDGGGIKGIIPCIILQEIERLTGYRISKLFDLVAGTSTGGILALGLTHTTDMKTPTYSAQEMLKLYKENGKDIFGKRQKKNIFAGLGSLLSEDLSTFTNRTYSVKGLEKVLDDKFKDAQLRDALADVFITTYSLEHEKPFYYASRWAKMNSKENDLIKEIARATSAAPTFFDPKTAEYNKQQFSLVDGGVFANNPAALAYAEAKEMWKAKKIKSTAVITASDDDKGFKPVVTATDDDSPFFMLSLGCGSSPTQVDFTEASQWATKDWIEPLLTNVLMQGVSESTHFLMHYLLPDYADGTKRYIRLEPEIPQENSNMDDASEENITTLVNIAQQFVAQNRDTIDQVCEILG